MEIKNKSGVPSAIFCWSGGKDSSYCLYKVLQEKQFDVKYLLTTINGQVGRISMHGVREELLDKQTDAIGIPVIKVRVHAGTNEEYEKQMTEALNKAKSEGVTHVIFGDIFLEDLRDYREKNLAKINLQAVFPLWKTDTKQLIHDFITAAFETVTCCINDGYFTSSWVGRKIDADFVKDLPQHVDPCGENGEYHTFCYAGPLFNKKISFELGEKIYKPLQVSVDEVCQSSVQTKGFWYCDLIPQ